MTTEKKVAGPAVMLQPLEQRTIRFWLVSMEGSSLIVHNFSGKVRQQIADKQAQKSIKGREAKSPQAEYDSCFYFDEKGRYGFPLMAFKGAAVSACTSTGKAIAKTQARQFFHVVGPPVVQIHYPADRPPHMPLNAEGEPEGDPVRVGPSKTADLRYRPHFDVWAVELTVLYNSRVISETQVLNLFNLAGFSVGIGDWRVEKNGNHGMFKVAPKPEWVKESA